jgi:hypothetical protein
MTALSSLLHCGQFQGAGMASSLPDSYKVKCWHHRCEPAVCGTHASSVPAQLPVIQQSQVKPVRATATHLPEAPNQPENAAGTGAAPARHLTAATSRAVKVTTTCHNVRPGSQQHCIPPKATRQSRQAEHDSKLKSLMLTECAQLPSPQHSTSCVGSLASPYTN